MGPRAFKAWQQAGAPDLIQPGKIIANTTRFMAIKLLFKPARKQTKSIIVGNVYCPTSDHEAMNEVITNKMYARTIKEIKRNTDPQTKIIIGGDFNATIGVQEDTSDKKYLGPHGLK